MPRIVPFVHSVHSDMVAQWGSKHAFPLPPSEFLPKVGYVVNDAVVGFLYTTDSKLGWIEWIIANPAIDKSDRAFAIDVLMETLVKEAEHKGLTMLFSSSKTNAFTDILQRNQFITSDSNMTHYIRPLAGIV